MNMQLEGADSDSRAGDAATITQPLRHAAGVHIKSGNGAADQHSDLEPVRSVSRLVTIDHIAPERRSHQSVQQSGYGHDDTAGLHHALYELQQDSSHAVHQAEQQQEESSFQDLQQQQQQVLLMAESQLQQGIGGSRASSPASPHMHQQRQQLLELQQQWAEQQQARIDSLAAVTSTSHLAYQQQPQHGSTNAADGAASDSESASGISAMDNADIAAAADGSSGSDNQGGDSEDEYAAGERGELGSPSSVFLPPGSLTSSLQFSQPPERTAAAAGVRGSAVLRMGIVRPSSPPLSPTPAAAAAAMAAAAPAAARQSLSALQLRCQALEVSLEQQAQQAQAAHTALAAAHAAHSAEQESMRQYYEVGLAAVVVDGIA
jgi:hypothetical protein